MKYESVYEQHSDRQDQNQSCIPGSAVRGKVQHHRKVYPWHIRRNSQRTNHPTQPTVGIDFLAKNLVHSGTKYRLQLWDTAGQERFRALIPNYLRDAHCAVVVFDVTSRLSFNETEMWVNLFN